MANQSIVRKFISETLSPAERRAADYIASAPARVIDQSVTEVARHAGISPPTVVRLCRRLGFDGFSALKIALARELGAGVPFVHQAVAPTDAPATVLDKYRAHVTATLERFSDGLPRPGIEQSVTRLATSERILLFGIGASGFVAADAEHKLFRLGLNTIACTDAATMLQAAALTDDTQTVVAISHSGHTRPLLDACRVALAEGAAVIALTSPSTPLAALATIALAAEVAEDTSVYTPMASRLAHLYLLDALQISVALAMGPQAVARLKRTKDVLRLLRDDAPPDD